MKRGVIFILLVISLSYFVFSESKTDIVMNQNDNVTLAGKNIKFLYASSGSAAFSVDGTNTLAYFNITKIYRGAKILIKEIYGNNIVLVDLTVDQVCGNGQCAQDEDCCTDCGCGNGLKCIGNNCIDASLNICIQNLDCNDNNTCTIDQCSGYKGTCSHEPLTSCINEDKCCPGNCNETSDLDCRKCPINECFIDDQCIKEGAIYNNSYCLSSILSPLKSNNQGCSNNFECDSGSCQNKICSKGDKKQTQQTNPNEPSKIDLFLKNRNNQYALFVLAMVLILIYVKFSISRKNNPKTDKGMNL